MKLTRAGVRGASLVEYGLLTGLVAVVAIGAVSATGLEVAKSFEASTTQLAQANEAAGMSRAASNAGTSGDIATQEDVDAGGYDESGNFTSANLTLNPRADDGMANWDVNTFVSGGPDSAYTRTENGNPFFAREAIVDGDNRYGFSQRIAIPEELQASVDNGTAVIQISFRARRFADDADTASVTATEYMWGENYDSYQTDVISGAAEGWVTYTESFVPNAGVNEIEITINGTASNGSIGFDDIDVRVFVANS